MSDRRAMIADRLRAIADDLDEVMFDELREAAAAGRRRPDEDRTLMAVRRSVDKAIRLLDGLGGREADDDVS